MESVVTDLDGVASANASFRKGTAAVVYDPSSVTPEQIAEQINSQTFYRARVASEFVKTATFKIPGLDSREKGVELERALTGLAGIVGGALNIESLTLDYDVREISPEQVVEIINRQTSFTASIDTSAAAAASGVESPATAVIRIEGMTDDQSASRVTGALLLDGIVDGSVNTEDATLTVVYDTAKLSAQKIVDSLKRAVPNNVTLVSVEEPGFGGSVLTSAWFILGLVGMAIITVLAWPVLKRKLQPVISGNSGTSGPRPGRYRGQRGRRK